MRKLRDALGRQGSRASCPRRGRDALDPGRNGNTRKGGHKVSGAPFALWLFALALTTTLAHAQRAADSLHVVGETIVTGARLAIPRANAIATKTPLPLRKTPLSVGIVPQALIEAQDGATLSDALANVSGVGVHTNFGVHDLFYLRGFDSLANGLVLSDGAPEPEATFYQLYNVARVEALKGPGAFLYGGNPLSGTINLVRKRPVPASHFARVNASVGSFSTYRATLDAGHGAWRVNALWQDSEGYRDGKNSSILAVNPTLRLDLGAHSTLHLDYEYLTSEHKADAGLPLIASQPFSNEGLLLLYGDALPDVPRTRSYQTPFDLSEQIIQRFRADYEWHLSPNFTLRDKFYYTRLDWPSRGTIFGGTTPNASGSLDLIRLLNALDDEQAIVGNQFEALWALDTGGLKHQLLFGLEFTRYQDDFTLAVNFLPPINLFAPQETATLEQLVPIPDESLAGETSAQTLAPYFVDRIILSSRVEFFVGGRFDLVDYDKTSTVNQRDPSATDSTYRPVPIDAQRDYRQLSPLLGAVFAPNDELSFYANIGSAFAPPSALAVGGLEPEKSRQGEVGIKAQLLDDKLDGRLALFHLQKDDIAIPDDNNLIRQVGDQRTRGLELELWARPAAGWYAQASYAYLDAELTRFNKLERKKLDPVSQTIVEEIVDYSNNTPAFVPEHLLTLWAARDLGENLTVAAGLRYVDSQFVAEDNVYEIDGALTLDCGLTYRRGPGLLRLNLKNATGREYETRGFGSTSVIPAAPFSFKATLGYSL